MTHDDHLREMTGGEPIHVDDVVYREYRVSVRCDEGCERDEAILVKDFRPDSGTNIDAVLHLVDLRLLSWNCAVGLPLVGRVQDVLSKLVGVLPQLEGVTPEGQVLATALTIGVVVSIRDAILAHRFAETRVSVELVEPPPSDLEYLQRRAAEVGIEYVEGGECE